jgi:hypothetical protein
MKNKPVNNIQVFAQRTIVARLSALDCGVSLITGGVLIGILLLLLCFCGIEPRVAMPLAALLGLTSLHFAELVRTPDKNDLFAPTTLFAAYLIVYFGFRSIYLLTGWFTVYWMGRNPYEDYLSSALWCASLGYISFLLGTRSRLSKRLTPLLPKGRPLWPRSLPMTRILGIMVVGLTSLIYLFANGMVVGNYGNEDFVNNPPPGLPVLLQSLINLSWIAVCTCLLLPRRMISRRAGWPLVLISVALLASKLAISGGKGSLIEPLVNGLIVFHYLKRRLRVWQVVAIALPSIVLAFGVVNFYRFVVVGQMSGSPENVSDLASRLSSTADYLGSGRSGQGQLSPLEQMLVRDAGVDALALIMKYTPDPQPFDYGRDWLKAPLSLIPRQIWKDKPIRSVGHDFEINYMGMPSDYLGFSSMHLISDLYRNFYLFGVVGGMFIFGASLQSIYVFCSPSPGNGTGVFLWAAFLPSIVGYLEGDAGSGLIALLRQSALLFATAAFLGVRYKRANPGKTTPAVYPSLHGFGPTGPHLSRGRELHEA